MATLTKEQARMAALHNARTKASRKAAEQHIASQIEEFQKKADSFKAAGAYHEYFALFPQFIHSISYGRLIEEHILDKGILLPGRYTVVQRRFHDETPL